MRKPLRSGGACTRRPEDSWRPRKRIRLEDNAYLGGEPFLLTVCTANRLKLLTGERYGRWAHEAMRPAADKAGATLWCGVVMPDHVHLLVTAKQGKSPLDVAACFKRLTTLGLRDLGFEGPLWQRRAHDRGLRHHFGNDLQAAVRYVLDNPVRHGLARSWADWPFQYLHQDIGTLS